MLQHTTATLDVSIKEASGYPLMGITLVAIMKRIQKYIPTRLYIDYEYRIFQNNKPGPDYSTDVAVAVIINKIEGVVSTMLLLVCCCL